MTAGSTSGNQANQNGTLHKGRTPSADDRDSYLAGNLDSPPRKRAAAP